MLPCPAEARITSAGTWTQELPLNWRVHIDPEGARPFFWELDCYGRVKGESQWENPALGAPLRVLPCCCPITGPARNVAASSKSLRLMSSRPMTSRRLARIFPQCPG